MKRITLALAAALACATLVSTVQAADQPIPVRTAEYQLAVASDHSAPNIDLVRHRYGRYYGYGYRPNYGYRSYAPYYGYQSYYRPNYGYRPYYGGYYNAYRPYGYGYRPGVYGGFYW